MSDISRRAFLTTTAAAGAGLTIVPRHVLGRGFQAPSDTVNIATVGFAAWAAATRAASCPRTSSRSATSTTRSRMRS